MSLSQRYQLRGNYLLFFIIGFIPTILFFAGRQSFPWILSVLMTVFAALSALCASAGNALISLYPAQYKRTGWRLTLLALGIAVAFMAIRIAPSGKLGIPPHQITGLRGVLIEDSSRSPNGETLLRLEVSELWSAENGFRSRVRCRVRVVVQTVGMQTLYRGRKITVNGGRVRAVPSSTEPFVVRVAANQIQPGPFKNKLLARRAAIRQAWDRRLSDLHRPVSGLSAALLFGERSGLDDAIWGRFRRSGSVHVLALSGLHLGILYAAVFALLFFIPDKRIRAVAAAVILLPYLLMVNPRPSLLRAAIMIWAGTAGMLLQRKFHPLNLLFLAAVVILIIDPFTLYSLSFQLSFLSLLGLILVGPVLSHIGRPYLPAAVLTPLTCALAAQLATTPLVMTHFGFVYPIGIVVSIIVLPLLYLFMMSGIVLLILPFTGAALVPLINGLYQVSMWVMDLASRVPGFRVERPLLLWIPVCCILLFFFWSTQIVRIGGRR